MLKKYCCKKTTRNSFYLKKRSVLQYKQENQFNIAAIACEILNFFYVVKPC